MNPEVIHGGIHTDARGALRFCNDFDMSAVKRFYTISNSAEQPIRGWIGHRRETKWFFPLKGTTTITVEPIDDFNSEKQSSGEAGNLAYDEMPKPSASLCLCVKKTIESYALDSKNPSVLVVPPGNWFSIEQHDGAEVMVFSDCKVGEYENDDFRRQL